MEGPQEQLDASASVEAIQTQPVNGIAAAAPELAVSEPVPPIENAPATVERPPVDKLTCALAGLQAGLLGVLWMLGWLGLSATWQNRSFWTAENLMATAFYGGSAIRPGFARETLSGMALYLLLYMVLGALLALVIRDRMPRSRVLLISIVFALAWYYVSFRLIWNTVLPLVALLHATQATVFGHVVYGVVLGRYPIYLYPRAVAKSVAPAA